MEEHKTSIKVCFLFTCPISFRLKNCDMLVCAIFKKAFVDSNLCFNIENLNTAYSTRMKIRF